METYPSLEILNLKTTLVLLGEAAVGKTSIVRRMTKGTFDNYSESTIGAAFNSYVKKYGNRIVKFEIWDTAGQERYRSITPLYYRNATSAFLVYDITSKDSFEIAKTYLRELKSYNTIVPVIILVGNKCDLEHKRKVTRKEGKKFAEDNGIFFCEISAKTSINTEHIFELVAKNIPENIQERNELELSSDDMDNKCCIIL
jgi:small GTP-binding protein